MQEREYLLPNSRPRRKKTTSRATASGGGGGAASENRALLLLWPSDEEDRGNDGKRSMLMFEFITAVLFSVRSSGGVAWGHGSELVK